MRVKYPVPATRTKGIAPLDALIIVDYSDYIGKRAERTLLSTRKGE
jgi:hypothetical protein